MGKLIALALVACIILIGIAGTGGGSSTSSSSNSSSSSTVIWYMLGYYNDHDIGVLAYYANQLGISYQSTWNVQANAYEFWIPTTADSGLLAKKFQENLDRK